ncbi:MAG: hypothetical protein ACRCTQ_00520 [Brevinemataceae bacterium]
MRKIIFFAAVLVFPVQIASLTTAWRYNTLPSLLLRETVGMVESNGSLMQDSSVEKGFLKTEDFVVDTQMRFSKLFMYFNKRKYSSYALVKIYDQFTDRLIAECIFTESDVRNITYPSYSYSRAYLTVEIYGDDIELFSAGVETEPVKIIFEKDFILNVPKNSEESNMLLLEFLLQEAAAVSLYIYDQNGNVCTKILDKKTLDAGLFRFQWNPAWKSGDITGKNYYIRLYASNFQLTPSEYVKDVYLMP